VTRLVVDASVAIKWVIDEPDSESALLLRRHHLLAPDLLIPECANILWQKVRRNELTEQEAALAARLLERADVDLAPMRTLLEPAVQWAITLDHPAYDCAYLALAITEACDFVTADEQLVRKSARAQLPVRVLSLRDAV
jgi:predicted nucleic acid-binding protein